MKQPFGKQIGLLAREILKAVGELAVAYLESPLGNPRAFSRMVYSQLNRPDVPYDARFYQTVRRLESAGYIRRTATKLELSPEARVLARTVSFEHLVLATPPWDGLWRVIIWDIPETNRTARNRARRILKSLGVIQIQQSVWVTPHPCRNEVQQLREELTLEGGLLYLEASRIEGQSALETHFKVRQS